MKTHKNADEPGTVVDVEPDDFAKMSKQIRKAMGYINSISDALPNTKHAELTVKSLADADAMIREIMLADHVRILRP